jgi:hypothetical protein
VTSSETTARHADAAPAATLALVAIVGIAVVVVALRHRSAALPAR